MPFAVMHTHQWHQPPSALSPVLLPSVPGRAGAQHRGFESPLLQRGTRTPVQLIVCFLAMPPPAPVSGRTRAQHRGPESPLLQRGTHTTVQLIVCFLAIPPSFFSFRARPSAA